MEAIVQAGMAAGEFYRHVLPMPDHLDFLTMPYMERWVQLLLPHLDRSL